MWTLSSSSASSARCASSSSSSSSSTGARLLLSQHQQHHPIRRPSTLLLAQCDRTVNRRLTVAARATEGDDQPSSSSSNEQQQPPAPPPASSSSLLDAIATRAAAGETPPSSSSSALDSPLLKAIAEQLEPPPAPPQPDPTAQQQQQPQQPQQQQQGQQPQTTTPTTTTTTPPPTVDAAVEIPPAVLRRIKQEVFAQGPFYVTEVESYGDGGAVFKGRVRAKDLSAAYGDLSARLEKTTEGAYQLFLLADRRDEPTAVVLPSSAREAVIAPVTEWWLAIAFGLATLVTSVDAAGAPLIQFLVDPFRTPLSADDLLGAAPLVAAEWGILFAHELGHRLAASRLGVGLYAPLLIPAATAGFLPSFGGITRFRGFLPDRNALLEISAAGPALGVAASGAFLALGTALTAAGMGDVTVDSASFADSLLAGVLAQICIGPEALASAPEVKVSSALLAGWAGITIQALNCLPLGELDGGRVSLALLGRRGARAVGVLGTGALAIASFSNALLGLWLLVVLILQRGPVLPCREELTDPPADSKARLVGALLLTALPAAVLLPSPLPVDLAAALLSGGGDVVTGGGAPLFGA